MFRRIVVPIDGSPTSNRGLDVAIELAADRKASLLLLHVVDDTLLTQSFDGTMYVTPATIDGLMQSLRESGREILARAEAKARKKGVAAETALIEIAGRRVADAIVERARKWRADLIVLGTHGRRGLTRMVMGSDAENVVRASPVPVLLVRAPTTSHPRTAKRAKR